MSIILIGGEKGGTGKTTLAVNLAALRALQGRDVLLIDTDIQASASYWAQSRDEAGIQPRVACIQKFGKGLQTEVRDLARRYQDLIIDAGGRDSAELRAALVVAERVYIPIQPSQFDIWTLGRMDDLVKYVGFSRARMFDMFKAQTGLTPNDYLQRLRVEKAQEQLRQGDLTVTDIALANGFSSGQYFSTVFTRYTGVSPTDFRNGVKPRNLARLQEVVRGRK